MATISSPGLGSNLDVNSIVSQLMAVERKPITALDTKETSYKDKLSAFGKIKSALSAFQKSAQDIYVSSAFKVLKANVADTSYLSASATGAALPGTYNVEVQSLAQAQKLISSDPGYSAVTSEVGSGTLTITLGKYTDATTFVPNDAKTPKTITIDSPNNTLEAVRDAINDADAGVTATIINNGTANYLSITSKDTGANNAIKITATESGTAGLAQLAYDPTKASGAKLTQNVAAKDAVIKLDNITISKPSNTITDAIEGVTLNLSKEMAAGTTTKITLTRDTATVRSSIEAFVKAYNDANQLIASSTAYNTETGKASLLTGDATARSMQVQLRTVLSDPIEGAALGSRVLSDIGIAFQKDGTLSIDSSKLDKALQDPNQDVSKLFVTTDQTVGYGARVNNLLKQFLIGSEGVLNSRIDGINTAIKGIATQRTQLNNRMTDIEKRYRAQFTALDVAISNMTKTSTFMTQQLSALNKSQQ